VFYFQASVMPDLNRVSFSSVVLYLFLFAILGTAILSTYNAEKEVEQRKLLAIDLASGEDPLTEYILRSMVEEMESDTHFIDLIAESPYSLEGEDRAIKYIEDNYLSDRLRKYEWMVTLCTPGRELILQPEEYIVNCFDYFDDIIMRIGKPALGPEQYRYANEAGLSNYISSRQYVLNNDVDTVNVYIELFSFFIQKEGLVTPNCSSTRRSGHFPGWISILMPAILTTKWYSNMGSIHTELNSANTEMLFPVHSSRIIIPIITYTK